MGCAGLVRWSLGHRAPGIRVFAVLRTRAFRAGLPWFLMGVGSTLSLFLIAMLLMVEGVFHFGLGDATDRILPTLKYLPMLLCVLAVPLALLSYREWRSRASSRLTRWSMTVHTAALLAMVIGLFYWDLVVV